jgi:hypothetical protein
MSLDGLVTRAEIAGEQAVHRKQSQILQNADLPAGVTLSVTAAGLELSGRGLRRRMIDDPRLRNFAR